MAEDIRSGEADQAGRDRQKRGGGRPRGGRPQLTLTVAETGRPPARTLACRLTLGEKTLSEKTLSAVESQEAFEICNQYASLFDKSCTPAVPGDYIDLLGDSLFKLFFKEGWTYVPEGCMLRVSSDLPEILALPWELTKTERGLLGYDMDFTIIRSAAARAPDIPLPPAPVSLLVIASEPMNYDREITSILCGLHGANAVVDICDTGRFDEMAARARALRPAVVHIAARRTISGGKPSVLFEGEAGTPDPRSPEDIAGALPGVRAVVVSGCGPQALPLEAVCRSLSLMVPVVIGWNGGAGSFYSALGEIGRADEALLEARRTQGPGRDVHGGDGVLMPPAVLYSTGEPVVFDPSTSRRIEPPEHRELLPLSGMASGYASDFVDRRRDVERLVPAIRDGSVKALIITGVEGIGKTALATRLIREVQGFLPVPVYSSPENPITAARVIDSCSRALLRIEGMGALGSAIRDPKLSMKDRIEKTVDGVNRARLLLFIDSPEMDDEGRISDPDLASLYQALLKGLQPGRMIVTSPVLPADAMTLPARAREWGILPLPGSAVMTFMLRDAGVSQIYGSGKISCDSFERISSEAGATPSCLDRIRRALSKGLIRPAEAESGACAAASEVLVAFLGPSAARDLCLSSVYNTPVTVEALKAVTDEDPMGFLPAWVDAGFCREVGPGLHIIDGRESLRETLGPEALAQARRRAADYLRILAGAGRSGDLGLSRLDCMMEARGLFIASGAAEGARDVTARISGYLERLGLFNEIVRQNGEILGMEEHPEPMKWMGMAYASLGMYPEAEEWYSRSLKAQPGYAACQGLGLIHLDQGKYDLAAAEFERAAELCRGMGDAAGEAAALHGLASIDIARKNDEGAREKLLKVLQIQQAAGDLRGEASTRQDLATIALRKGDYALARNETGVVLELMERAGDRSGASAALSNMASLAMQMGEFDAARADFERALPIKRDIGDLPGEASVLHSLGEIDLQKGERLLAWDKFETALRINQEIGDRSGEAAAFFYLGFIAVQMNHIADGLELMALAGMILQEAGSADAERIVPVIENLASQLKYSQDQFTSLLRDVKKAHARDKGASLVRSVKKMLGGR